ncbi:Uncharacterised protein [Legionella longbeachae]|uniref:Uncharacterized protein n=2 Tax=Legionella oakridgensis TaxID=29423 RepID=A0A0W0X0H8_9GAMM|nr:hypothetical protein Loak_1741 [Legionella oakridgensis]STY20212.1 Uncharacterised protein [Legionella longbeachae]
MGSDTNVQKYANNIRHIIKECSEYKEHIDKALLTHLNVKGEIDQKRLELLGSSTNNNIKQLLEKRRILIQLINAIPNEDDKTEEDKLEKLKQFQSILESNKNTLEKSRDTYFVRFIKAIAFSFSCAFFWIAPPLLGSGDILRYKNKRAITIPGDLYNRLYTVEGQFFFEQVNTRTSYELDITSWIIKKNKILLKLNDRKLSFIMILPNGRYAYGDVEGIDLPNSLTNEFIRSTGEKIKNQILSTISEQTKFLILPEETSSEQPVALERGKKHKK